MSTPSSVVAVNVVDCSGVVLSPVSSMTGAVVSMLLKVMDAVPMFPAASMALKYHVPLSVTVNAPV